MAITERKKQTLIIVNIINSEESDVIHKIFNIVKNQSIKTHIIKITSKSISFTLPDDQKLSQDILINKILVFKNITINIEDDLSLTAIIGNNLNKIPLLSNKISSVVKNTNMRLSSYGVNGKSLCLLTGNENTIGKIHSLLF